MKDELPGCGKGLRGLGWVEGRNLRLDIHRARPNTCRPTIRSYIDELLTGLTGCYRDFRRYNDETDAPGGQHCLDRISLAPLIPWALDWSSLAHPGGNVLGFSQLLTTA